MLLLKSSINFCDITHSILILVKINQFVYAFKKLFIFMKILFSVFH